MILHAYTIYDRKSLQYHQPFFAVADGAAVRMLSDIANDPNTSIGRHPSDYVLYRCGGYDDSSGQLLPVTALHHITDALPLVQARSPLPFDPQPVASARSAAPVVSGDDSVTAETRFNGSGV